MHLFALTFRPRNDTRVILVRPFLTMAYICMHDWHQISVSELSDVEAAPWRLELIWPIDDAYAPLVRRFRPLIPREL